MQRFDPLTVSYAVLSGKESYLTADKTKQNKKNRMLTQFLNLFRLHLDEMGVQEIKNDFHFH